MLIPEVDSTTLGWSAVGIVIACLFIVTYLDVNSEEHRMLVITPLPQIIAARTLAQLLLSASRMRENSHDRADSIKYGETPDADAIGDFNQFYRKTLRQACEEACGPKQADAQEAPMEQIVFLLLYCSWNDALVWANSRTNSLTKDEAGNPIT